MVKKYRSQIPATAREKVVERYDDGSVKVTEYFLHKQLVGRRHWDTKEDGGHVIWDMPFRDGVRDGMELSFYSNGQIELVEPYVGGVIHGTARQYAPDGRLLGTYRLFRGTGVDLCRDCMTGKLREEWHLKDGAAVCCRRWNGDDRTIRGEYYCRAGAGYYGIRREWNEAGRLRRAFPQYYLDGKQVSKRQYLRAREIDATLPKYIKEEDQPQRKLPSEYVAQLNRRPRKRRLGGSMSTGEICSELRQEFEMFGEFH